MLTPRFEISQTDEDITVTIHAPYANVAETEIFVEEEHFRFYSPPYYLRLHLPGSVEETDSSTGSYDADSGIFVVRVSKVKKGEHFPDLDLLTTLLAPRKSKVDVGKAGIEVLGEPCVPREDEEEEDNGDSEWFIEQSIEDPLAELTGSTSYGFAGHSKGVFARFQGELSELLDLPEPDMTPVSDRRRLQEEREKQDFCAMHYLADIMEPEYVKYLIAYQPTYNIGSGPLPKHIQTTLLQLPNREYLLTGPEKRSVYLGLVDLLFAYCYDQRINEGETNSESAWNINKLSATLSWLQVFTSMEGVLVSCLRRSLVYPLYRNWQLSLKVLEDVQAILAAGKKEVLCCLVEVYNLFFSGELRYLLNRLYIQDYCIWVQQCSATKLASMASAIAKSDPSKEDLGLELVEWETAGRLAQEDEQQASLGDLADRLDSMLAINPPKGEGCCGDDGSEHSSKSDEEASVSSGSSNDTDSDSYDSESDSESSSGDGACDPDSDDGSDGDLDSDDLSASD